MARSTIHIAHLARLAGIYHKNWAARNKSRLSKKVIALILQDRAGGAAPAVEEPEAVEA